MASQMYGVTGKKRKPYTYVDQINEARAFLPGMIAQKAQTKYLEGLTEAQDRGYQQTERELGLKESDLGIAKQGLDLRKRGLAETTRANVANEALGRSTLNYQQKRLDYQNKATEKEAGLGVLSLAGNLMNSNVFNNIGSGWNLGKTNMGPLGSYDTTGLLKTGGLGLLSGYGAGKAFGSSKGKKLLYGAGAGLLSGLLSGGSQGWGSVGTGLIGGALGGLFS